jgi:hypothetical protein
VALSSRFGVGGSVYHHGVDVQVVDHIPFGAYPTDLVRRLGGWDERLVANEDFEFDHRLRGTGAILLFDPRLRIEWQSKQSLRDLFAQYRRYGRGKVDVAMLHPSSLRLRHYLPPVLVAQLISAAACAPFRPRLAAGMAAPYAVALVLASTTVAHDLDQLRAKAVLPGAFAAMHLGWGLGVWSRVLEIAIRRGAR